MIAIVESLDIDIFQTRAMKGCNFAEEALNTSGPQLTKAFSLSSIWLNRVR